MAKKRVAGCGFGASMILDGIFHKGIPYFILNIALSSWAINFLILFSEVSFFPTNAPRLRQPSSFSATWLHASKNAPHRTRRGLFVATRQHFNFFRSQLVGRRHHYSAQRHHTSAEAAIPFSITATVSEICQTRQNPRRMRGTRV